MKNNMENLTITKEKVLEAASKCDTAKATLKVLFPEVFENEWNPFIKKFGPMDACDINKKFFGGKDLFYMLDGATPHNRPDLKGRAFFLTGDYEILTSEAGNGVDGTVIEIRKK